MIASCTENTLPGFTCLLDTSSCSSSKCFRNPRDSRNYRTSLLSSFLLLSRYYAFPPSSFLKVLVATHVQVSFATSSGSFVLHLPLVSLPAHWCGLKISWASLLSELLAGAVFTFFASPVVMAKESNCHCSHTPFGLCSFFGWGSILLSFAF